MHYFVCCNILELKFFFTKFFENLNKQTNKNKFCAKALKFKSFIIPTLSAELDVISLIVILELGSSSQYQDIGKFPEYLFQSW